MSIAARPAAPRDPLARLLEDGCPPFALLRRRTPGHDHDVVEVLIGSIHEVETLAEIPVSTSPSLALIPFRQIRERGFEVTDDGTPLSVLIADESEELPLDEAIRSLPTHPVRMESGSFDIGDEEYADVVRRVIADEIGQGEGANFVIRRTFTGQIPGFGRADALALFRLLLTGERNAYWTFVVHTGERTLVGASPEVHVRMSGDTVVMNPISGTFRYPPQGPDPESLLRFLDDRKERDELSMVVDEELKMMCTVGDQGGVVIGPRLKEMAHLAHTEYELRGRSSLDVREVLKETMFAATVTGSPVQNACRVIRRYETGGRGYYAGALALLSVDAHGQQTLDSPITIRTADIDAVGGVRVPVGATLVRHSDPLGEVAETHAKVAGVLAALGVGPQRPRADAERPRLMDDPRVRAALDSRRALLAPFWLRMQERAAEPLGHALMVDGEDTFTAMLAHLLRSTGREVTVRRYDEPGLREAALSHPGLVVLGPGPGDPTGVTDPKMRSLRALTAELLQGHRGGLLGVCLGHELIAAELGVEIVRKAEPYQGAQERIELFGRTETVGFYNSFTARCDERAAAELSRQGVEVARDPQSGDVHALRAASFASVQFHPESVLTLNGPAVVSELLEGSVLRQP